MKPINDKDKLAIEQIKKMLELFRESFGEQGIISNERKLGAMYADALQGIQSDLGALFQKVGDKPSYADVMKYQRLANLENQIAARIKDLTGRTLKLVSETITGQMEYAFYSNAFTLENVLDAKLGFGTLNEGSVKAALENPYDRITWDERLVQHSNDYIRILQQELGTGFSQGKGYATIANAIEARTSIAAGKVACIVRTEGHRAQSTGRMEANDKAMNAAERLGIEIKRVWHCVLDSLTREAHAKADGQAADENGMFHVGGELLQAPGVGGSAANVINCRCDEVVRIAGAKNIRLDNITKERVTQDFEDWQKSKGIKMKYWKAA